MATYDYPIGQHRSKTLLMGLGLLGPGEKQLPVSLCEFTLEGGLIDSVMWVQAGAAVD